MPKFDITYEANGKTYTKRGYSAPTLNDAILRARIMLDMWYLRQPVRGEPPRILDVSQAR